jgi:flagellar basal-body rod modification protein FlgD
MTTTYGPVGAFPTSSTTGTSSTTPTAKDSNTVDTDMFLKLLVAQLKYQDPNNTTDPSEFLSQSAQFSTVEKLSALEKLAQKAYDSSQQQAATSLIGKTITYTTASGDSATGVVTSASVNASIPNLTVNGINVSLDAVTAVSAPAANQANQASQTGSTTGSGATG